MYALTHTCTVGAAKPLEPEHQVLLAEECMLTLINTLTELPALHPDEPCGVTDSMQGYGASTHAVSSRQSQRATPAKSNSMYESSGTFSVEQCVDLESTVLMSACVLLEGISIFVCV